MKSFEKNFPTDKISKRERIELTFKHQAVDRVPIVEQLSYNSGVISLYTGKTFKGFDYTRDDVCEVVRKTTDLIMPPISPLGNNQYTTEDGFVVQNDQWNSWYLSRPFQNVEGARDWLIRKTEKLIQLKKQPQRHHYHIIAGAAFDLADLQKRIGETVLLNYSRTGFMDAYTQMGLELFAYLHADYPDVVVDFMKASVAQELLRIHAIADKELAPVVLIPEEFAIKQGPTFPPKMLALYQYPHVKTLTDAWHEHGVMVMFASGGNYRKVIPELLDCNLDGFYGLEPACEMEIVDLTKRYPGAVWAGGVDGTDLMERGTPEQVKAEVHRQIQETNALQRGGMIIGSSSEINPSIKPENFRAMVEAVGEMQNPSFAEAR